ncbi:hypothetical protein COCCADRAFT_36139 [Bipolaris zeicola 26-R-13]|uniref:Uncharacterized protein n=1 Tax=Cochliobolus carbonum (strain 26-R-13) TaxID=930089 RepID=W6YRR6_COCC2|nr:uncharacterized protein COCCADRAFT_36139 [Bipolaris zeicola 26-R-13]EUC34186.1 hypothetical protein COCCADRAFT_36139 [Bipolaris zeicola 26-R-13]
MPLISITATSTPTGGGYRIFSPYTDDDTAFANNTLCPRYAECDPTSAPPSPASIESLEIFDSIPWRRDYIALDPRTRARHSRLRAGWMQNKVRATIVLVLLLLAVLAAGTALVLYLSVVHGKSK